MRIVFTGDICFDMYFSAGWEKEGCLSKETEAFLRDSDYVVANVEGPLTRSAYSRNNTQVHASDPDAGAYLSSHNMTVWNLGNNHMMDCSEEGLKDTLACAEKNHCTAIGAGLSLADAEKGIILGNDVKVGILSIANPWPYVKAGEDKAGEFTWDRTSDIKERIKELKKTVRWVILVVHGGDEFSSLSTPDIRKKYHSLLDLGADIIVGHHPHVVQEMEKTGDKVIFYSLGNFIFDTDYQRSFDHTENGILLGIDLEEAAYTFDYMPICINRETQMVEAAQAAPSVFCHVDETEYKLLWPLAARKLYNDNKKKWVLTQRRFTRANSLLGSVHMLYGLRQKRSRVIAKGKMTSYLNRWKKSQLPEVCEYLKGH